MFCFAIKKLLIIATAAAFLASHEVSKAVDIHDVLPDAWDQPRINLLLRQAPDADPLISFSYALIDEDVFNIEAFLDTGASSIVLSAGQSLFVQVRLGQ